jgi:hypothetical protein
MTVKSGRYRKCKVVYQWSGAPLVRDAICFYGHQLRPTTHLCQDKKMDERPWVKVPGSVRATRSALANRKGDNGN